MDEAFWHQKWQSGQIGFHRNDTNPFLLKYFSDLGLQQGQRVFLPLCGKTLDISWLLSQGYHVLGIELHEQAVIELFEQLQIIPNIMSLSENLKRYSAERLDIYVGNFFSLTPDDLGNVDAVYDRAALVALPESMRSDYCQYLITLTNHAPILLITYNYDQTKVSGPPFSISNEEVALHYQQNFELKHLEQTEVDGGHKGLCPAQENVWLIS